MHWTISHSNRIFRHNGETVGYFDKNRILSYGRCAEAAETALQTGARSDIINVIGE